MSCRPLIALLFSLAACASPPAEETASGDEAVSQSDDSVAIQKTCADAWTVTKSQVQNSAFMSKCIHDLYTAQKGGLEIALIGAHFPDTAPTGQSWEDWGRLPNPSALLQLDQTDGNGAKYTMFAEASASKTLTPELDAKVVVLDGATASELHVVLTDNGWLSNTDLVHCTIALDDLGSEGTHDVDCTENDWTASLTFQVRRR